MKKYLIFTLALAFGLASCEEDLVILDNTDLSNSLLSFEDPTGNLPVEQGSGSNTLDLVVEVSTISDADRTFDVAVVTSESTASPAFYNVPSTVTIPAGSYEGTMTVTGNEVPSLTTTPTSIVIELSDSNDVLFQNQRAVVDVFLVCPVPANYLIGAFDIINLVQRTGPAFGRTNFKGESNADPTLVTLVEGSSATVRQFKAQLLAGGAQRTPQTITLNLVCGKINLAQSYNLGFAPDSQGRTLFFAPSEAPSNYNVTDPSQVSVNYLENPENAYAPTRGEATFLLRKR